MYISQVIMGYSRMLKPISQAFALQEPFDDFNTMMDLPALIAGVDLTNRVLWV
jgi:hypothetical protein